MHMELYDCIYMTLPSLEITLLKLGDLMQVLKKRHLRGLIKIRNILLKKWFILKLLLSLF